MLHCALVGHGPRRTPLQNFLCPVHAQIVVHPAGQNHLLLGRIPHEIVGRALLQLFLTIEDGADREPARKGSTGPRLQAFNGLIGRIKANKIDGKFTPHDDLLEKCGFRDGGRIALPNATVRGPMCPK